MIRVLITIEEETIKIPSSDARLKASEEGILMVSSSYHNAKDIEGTQKC